MPKVRALAVLLLASLWASGAARAANRSTLVDVSHAQASTAVAKQLRARGVRGDLVREVDRALANANGKGRIVRAGRPFVGTSFGADWTYAGGKPGRAVVSFRGKRVDVEILRSNGVSQTVSSWPVPASAPLAFQGMRVEHWSARKAADAELRIVGSDGEIAAIDSVSPRTLAIWAATR